MLLSKLADFLQVDLTGEEDVEIIGVNFDSRKVMPGDLFVCISGLHSDGHQFIPQALKKGAVAFLTNHLVTNLPDNVPQIVVPDTRVGLAKIAALWHDFPGKKLRMIGVTGTNGKTTTTHLIKGLLELKGGNIGLIGTVHNLIGQKELPTNLTTPEAFELCGLLKQMVEENMDTVVMEVSSHALKQNRVNPGEYDVAVFTNISQDHLDYHHNFQDYLNSKLKLFQDLHEDCKNGDKYVVINSDDDFAGEFKSAAQLPIWTFGIRDNAQVQAKDIRITSQGTFFTLLINGISTSIRTSLIGNFNIYNVLAAITIAFLEGVPLSLITDYLVSAPQVAGRFELIDEGQPFPVIVDYAHTPDGLENILKTAREITAGRLITIFGCGGDRDRGKRPIMGEISGQLSDFTIITSDNPRTEDPMTIIKEIEKGISLVTDKYEILPERKDAIYAGIKMATPGDMVIIAGKGHEDYQLLPDKKIHFDDREVARLVLQNLK